MSFDLSFAKAMVAVGMKGDMVILTASSDSSDSSDSRILGDKTKIVRAKQLLDSSSLPLAPVLHEFNGSTRSDLLESCAPDSLHFDQFEVVTSYATY
jgi:hypothetical protein